VEQAPPLNNLLPPQAFHFFIFIFFLTNNEKMPWRFMRVCTHTHTRKRNISLGNPRCVYTVCRERETNPGTDCRSSGGAVTPPMGGRLPRFFLSSISVILSYLEVPTFRGNTHTHTPKDWRKR
jgi:hypothetical protein